MNQVLKVEVNNITDIEKITTSFGNIYQMWADTITNGRKKLQTIVIISEESYRMVKEKGYYYF